MMLLTVKYVDILMELMDRLGSTVPNGLYETLYHLNYISECKYYK